jgi:hypothetical protein
MARGPRAHCAVAGDLPIPTFQHLQESKPPQLFGLSPLCNRTIARCLPACIDARTPRADDAARREATNAGRIDALGYHPMSRDPLHRLYRPVVKKLPLPWPLTRAEKTHPALVRYRKLFTQYVSLNAGTRVLPVK